MAVKMKTITFKPTEKLQALAKLKVIMQGLDSSKQYDVEIKEHREKRSLNANNYMWQLIGELSQAMSIPPVELYCGYIKDIGIYKDIALPSDSYKTVIHAWERQGIGWLTDIVDEYGDFVTVRFYYGSSSYNTKQMSVLIDNVVQDCIALDIETKTPDEIARLVSLWESQK